MRRRSSSSQITEDRRGHSAEEGGVQSGHTWSGEVRVQSRSNSIRITEDRWGHSTEEGSVQSGHTRSGEVRVQSRRRSNFVGSQRIDEVTVQYRQVSSQLSHRSDKFRVQRRQKVQPQLRGGGSHERRWQSKQVINLPLVHMVLPARTSKQKSCLIVEAAAVAGTEHDPGSLCRQACRRAGRKASRHSGCGMVSPQIAKYDTSNKISLMQGQPGWCRFGGFAAVLCGNGASRTVADVRWPVAAWSRTHGTAIVTLNQTLKFVSLVMTAAGTFDSEHIALYHFKKCVCYCQ